MTQEQDFLTGSVPKKLIQFAFPLFLANLLQALYNVVDMLVVGKIVGQIGLAAISNASMLCFIINSLCIGLTMGGSVLVAQYKGAGDQKGQRDTISWEPWANGWDTCCSSCRWIKTSWGISWLPT